MKSKLAVALGMMLLLSVALVTPAEARKPVGGAMDLGFNLGWTEPSLTVPTWVGTVTIDDVAYGMAFFNVGTGKPFAERPETSQAAFFGERWEIYEVGTGVMDPLAFVPGSILMAGPDRGVASIANDRYRMNGSVAEADGIFSHLVGRNVHMAGVIEFYPFGAPQFAPGEFRIN